MGRLFDAAASILGLADFNSHQGRCAMALESAARRALQKNIVPLPMQFKKGNDSTYDPSPVWQTLCDLHTETEISAAALGFHNAITDMVVDMAENSGVRQIALCGGCFANRILLESCVDELQKRGFAVYYNQKVSCGDGGISLGQAYYGLLKLNETE